jgi:acyl-CoA synthetase (AMP-forming)/AMP-acid ligase II
MSLAPWGAVVIGDATVEQLPAAARKRLSPFKVPTVWLLFDSDDAIPRGGTGKVDVHELRRMLTTQLEVPH